MHSQTLMEAPMRKKPFLALIALLVVLVGGVLASTTSTVKTDICSSGSGCCDECCFPGSPCCFPGSPCCDGSCCADAGSPAVKAKTPCCQAGTQAETCCSD
jgi:hypothetical protein